MDVKAVNSYRKTSEQQVPNVIRYLFFFVLKLVIDIRVSHESLGYFFKLLRISKKEYVVNKSYMDLLVYWLKLLPAI